MLLVKDTGGGDFLPHPVGFEQAVCVDVVDSGMKESKYGLKHKGRIVWETTVLMPATAGEPNPAPFIVQGTFTMTLAERGNLRKMLESWRGAKFNEAELKGFDLERLLGVNAQLQIVHSAPDADGKIWANVAAVVPLSKGMVPIKPSGRYMRVIDRPQASGQTSQKGAASDAGDTDNPSF